MLKSHEKFHSANGKRLVLIADDEFVNRELLKAILQDDYEIIMAGNGQETLDMIYEYKDDLTLVLLDLVMPVMDGTEVLRRVKADPEVSQIPIIVLTSEQDAEVMTLTLGAADFIPKPYPQSSIILARVLRTIELSEDRQIISSTERDPLTGLYNREYFYSYAEQYDQHHRDVEMDALVVDMNHFHMINERFGTDYGNEVLRCVSEVLREEVSDVGGIVCRREADIFLIYCPHGKDYDELLENTTVKVSGRTSEDMRTWLRMGVYANVDKTMEIERRFDRAKMAADTVRGSFTSQIGIYDSSLHEIELYQEQLIDDFETALRDKQFKVYYQPQFDVQPEIPVLISAEALVRWQHPELGMISPGVFIPLFEENGLIQKLDLFVWQEAVAQIDDWRSRFGFVVPVSVNVSRIDMYDPHLVDILLDLLREKGLSTNELLLEITESAYTQDSEQIIATVSRLRRLGFRVEMDDFGTGYSSLNMISTLPIDALKMDMEFIHNAFEESGDTKMLGVVIDIADYLSIPVIAEGVETEEQMITLREMGCDFVQGYYFSRPVPAEEYEQFMVELKQRMEAEGVDAVSGLWHPGDHGKGAYGVVTHAISSGFESIYYIDTDSGHYIKFNSQSKTEDLQIEHSGTDFFQEAVQEILETVAEGEQARIRASMRKEVLLSQLTDERPILITYHAVVDGDFALYSIRIVKAYTHDDHHIVIGVSNVDAQGVEIDEFGNKYLDSTTYAGIAQALATDYFSVYYVNMENDHFTEYNAARDQGRRGMSVERAGDDFFGFMRSFIAQEAHPDDVGMVLSVFQRDQVLKELDCGRAFTLTYRLMVEGEPAYVHLKAIKMEGITDSHIVIGVSNVDEQIRREQEYARALRMANQDALTGVKSKHAYDTEVAKIDQAIEEGTQEPFALAVCDINGLKEVNDSQGHSAGDQYIREACAIICKVFAHSPVFRIGGDEFVVILRGTDYEDRDELMARLEKSSLASLVVQGASVAGGISIFDPDTDKSLAPVFERADAAMYGNKKRFKEI